MGEKDSQIIFNALMYAEESNKSNHGFARLRRLKELLDSFSPTKEIEVTHETASSCLLECSQNPGYLAAQTAVNKCNELLTNNPIAIVGGANCDSLGVLGYYTRQLSWQNFVAIATTTSLARIAPWGGTEAFSGTNPLSIAMPTGSEPIVYDASCSKVTVGDVLAAIEQGRMLSDETLLDAKGLPTTDPTNFRSGSLCPEANHKGAGLALPLDLLAGPMVGARGSKGGALGTFGFTFIAINPNLLHPNGCLHSNIAKAVQTARTIPHREAGASVMLPGENSARSRLDFKETLEVNAEVLKILNLRSH